MKRHIVFDLDGTLVESLPGIAEGLNRALAAVGLPAHPQSAVRKMIGRGASVLCANAIGYAHASDAPPELLEAVHSAFRREYPHCWQGGNTTPFPWVGALLAFLAAEGAEMAVLSNKPQDVTLPIVKSLFPHVPFTAVLGHSEVFPRKPAPDSLLHLAHLWGVAPQDITLVGDSLIDAKTAANAGCRLALVAWGYADPAALVAVGAPVFGTVDELRRFLG